MNPPIWEGVYFVPTDAPRGWYVAFQGKTINIRGHASQAKAAQVLHALQNPR